MSVAWLADRDVALTFSDLAALFAFELKDELALDQLRQRAAVDAPGQFPTAKEPDTVAAAVVRPVELLALRAIPPLDVLGLAVLPGGDELMLNVVEDPLSAVLNERRWRLRHASR